MINEDNYGLCNLFDSYHDEVRKLKEENRKGHIDFLTLYEKREDLKRRYARATYLLFTEKVPSFTDLMTVDTFIEIVKHGGINGYDGVGSWLDWDGNVLGPVGWSAADEMPDAADFVAWYNK